MCQLEYEFCKCERESRMVTLGFSKVWLKSSGQGQILATVKRSRSNFGCSHVIMSKIANSLQTHHGLYGNIWDLLQRTDRGRTQVNYGGRVIARKLIRGVVMSWLSTSAF